MNKYKIEFSKEAKTDLTSIVKYIKYELKEPSIATKLSNKIKKNIYNLTNNPQIFSIIDDNFIKTLELRKLIVDNYIVFYKIIEQEEIIQIARIMNGRRNWRQLL